MDDATQTVLVKAPIAGAGDRLRAAQYVRAEVVWSIESRLLLPVIAVQRLSDQHFAFVAEDVDGGLVARQRPVEVGPVIGDSYVVRGGLAAGDRLVLAGAQKIADGVPVQPLPARPPGSGVAAGAAQEGG